MFQSAAAELTIWVAIKCLDFYPWLDRLSFLITPVHFPRNAGMYPYADSFRVQRAQSLQRVETAKVNTSKMERRRGKGENKKKQLRGVFWIDYLQTVCQQQIRDRSWLATITGVVSLGLSF